MRVLVACEFSGVVREAFRAKGHNAWSCDLRETTIPSDYHFAGDVFDMLDNRDWDLLIAHPPCTYLTLAGNRWFYHPSDKHLPVAERRPHPLHPNRRQQRDDGAAFFMRLVNANCKKIAVENPICVMSSIYRKPDQIIHPSQFGHDAAKATCLWLKGLPKLIATDVVPIAYITTSKGVKYSKWSWDTFALPAAERAKARSVTFQGIANAMADQWG